MTQKNGAPIPLSFCLWKDWVELVLSKIHDKKRMSTGRERSELQINMYMLLLPSIFHVTTPLLFVFRR
jgi:hypothetical protein